MCVIVESCFEKNKCCENLICTKKKRENDLFALAGEKVYCCFNCGSVAIGKNYREEEEDDDDEERLDDFEGAKASKPF